MELVYLWIEDYKNIKKQGFNFSPRFDCDYNGENLTIEEKKHTSIFPDNINITAIVGENGSGKSSILELLHRIFSGYIKQKIFLLFYYKEERYIFNNLNTSISTDFSNIVNITNLNKFEQFKKVLDIYFPNENNKILYSNKNKNEFNLESIDSSHIIKHLLRAFKLLDDKSLDTIFSPKYLKIIIDYNSLEENLDYYEESHLNSILENIEKLKNNKYLDSNEVLMIVFNILDLKSNRNNIYYSVEEDFNDSDRMHKYYSCEEYQYENKERLKYLCNKINFSKYNEQSIKFEISDINTEILEFLYKLPNKGFILELYNINNINFKYLSFGEKNILSLIGSFFSLAYEESYKEYGIEMIDVGDCEEDYVEMDIEYNEKIEYSFFIIDEYELGLHPQWQKEMLSKVNEIFKAFNKNIHLIITTHSPFIVSDLPKENVIFLDKYKSNDKEVIDKKQKVGNCKNISNFIEIEQTFGANIHTLLSHGFFMKDGLMGEFAKGKIEEIKNFYEKVKEDKNPKINFEIEYNDNIEKFRHIQSIIGEPFLQIVIKNYLDELDILFNGKKQFLSNEIKRLQELQKNLDD